MPAASAQRFTVLGGRGFIGSHLVSHLRASGYNCNVPERDQILELTGSLGHVIYCIGLTADFRDRPFDTIEAHTGLFAKVLRDTSFDSLLYLSSARVYQTGDSGAETAAFVTDPNDPSQLYNLSKLTAECLCLSAQRPNVRIVRLSNVYGPDFESNNFLTDVIRQAVAHGNVRIEMQPDSAKDYVALADVTEMLPRIALGGRHRIYNLASGRNVSNAEIVKELCRCIECRVEWPPAGAPTVAPIISIDRLKGEFGYAPRLLTDELPSLVASYRNRLGTGQRAGGQEK